MALKNLPDKTLREIYLKIRSIFTPNNPVLNIINDNNIEKHFSLSKSPCVFVLSTGRVGTQTLAFLLDLSNSAFVYHEPQPLLYGLSNAAYKYSDHLYTHNSMPIEVLKESFLTSRRSLLHYSIQFGNGYIETSPQVTFLASIIVKVVPQAKFIHLVRDPRYVVRSGMRRKWYGGHPADDTRIVPDPTTEEGRKWETYNLFEKNAWLWAETNKKIEEFLQAIPSQQKLFVKSEQLFSNDQDTIKEIFDFVGSPLPPKSKIKRILGKNLNRQRTGNFLDVDEWEVSMMTTLKAMTAEVATRYGYFSDS